jgi:hypothetical protein
VCGRYARQFDTLAGPQAADQLWNWFEVTAKTLRPKAISKRASVETDP